MITNTAGDNPTGCKTVGPVCSCMINWTFCIRSSPGSFFYHLFKLTSIMNTFNTVQCCYSADSACCNSYHLSIYTPWPQYLFCILMIHFFHKSRPCSPVYVYCSYNKRLRIIDLKFDRNRFEIWVQITSFRKFDAIFNVNSHTSPISGTILPNDVLKTINSQEFISNPIINFRLI